MPEIFPTQSTAPAGNAATITPNDDTDLDDVTRAIYVGVSGDLTIDLELTGTQITFTAVPVGILPIRAKRVRATGTTATNMLALW